jgi:hypothetical protein
VLEREEQARLMMERDQTAERLRIAGLAAEMVAARTAGIKLGREVLADLMTAFVSMVHYYAPFRQAHGPDGRPILDDAGDPVLEPRPNGNPAEFKDYGGLALACAKELAQYQSPKLKAIVVAAPAPEPQKGEPVRRFGLRVFEGGRAAPTHQAPALTNGAPAQQESMAGESAPAAVAVPARSYSEDEL